jgi:hypothetical protein
MGVSFSVAGERLKTGFAICDLLVALQPVSYDALRLIEILRRFILNASTPRQLRGRLWQARKRRYLPLWNLPSQTALATRQTD